MIKADLMNLCKNHEKKCFKKYKGSWSADTIYKSLITYSSPEKWKEDIKKCIPGIYIKW